MVSIQEFPKAPVQWNREFVDALESQDGAKLEALVQRYRKDPSLAGSDEMFRTPLRRAIWALNPWGIQYLLQHHPTELGLEEVNGLFLALATCDEDHLDLATGLIQSAWPALRTVFETSAAGRLQVLAALMDDFPGPPVARHCWQALGMREWCAGIVDQPYTAPGEQYNVTALQMAWLRGGATAAALLLDAGASPVAVEPSCELSTWSLVAALSVRDHALAHQVQADLAGYDMPDSHLKTLAKQRWPTFNPALQEKVADAFTAMCQAPQRWAAVENHVRALQLEQRLPAPRPRSASPRF